MAGTISSDEKQSIPRSARLPSTTPEGTREAVTAIAEIAGSVSRERLASHLGKALTGGIARAMGSAKVYGFITTDAYKKLIITERGLAFVGDDPSLAKQAEREALMVTGFGVVIKKLSTRAASEDVIALRLAEDLNITEPADCASGLETAVPCQKPLSALLVFCHVTHLGFPPCY